MYVLLRKVDYKHALWLLALGQSLLIGPNGRNLVDCFVCYLGTIFGTKKRATTFTSLVLVLGIQPMEVLF